MGCGYKGLVFCKDNGCWIMEKNGQGIHCTKMGPDKSIEKTQNDPEFICLNCLPKPKSLGFWWKKASVVRVLKNP